MSPREPRDRPLTEDEAIRLLTIGALIAASVLLLASVALAPRPDDPADLASVQAAYATGETGAKTALLAGAAGAWALVLGFAHVHHHIGHGAGAALGRLAFYGFIVGVSILSAGAGAGLGAVEAAVAGTGATSSVETATGIAMLGMAAMWSALVLEGIAWSRIVAGPSAEVELMLTAVTGALGAWAFAIGIWTARKAW